MKGDGGSGQIEEKDKVEDEILPEAKEGAAGADAEKEKEAAISSLPPHLKRRVL